MNRREFLQVLAAASASGMLHPSAHAASDESFYDVPSFGNIRILHTCDMHAQTLPVYFREPGTNIGAAADIGRIPHIVGKPLLDKYDIPAGQAQAYALAYLNFDVLSEVYGKVGGLAHIATLCEKLRGDFGRDKTLHLDSGDMLQGSAIALKNFGRDMIEAANLLGVDAMTGHWEFTYPEAELRKTLKQFNGDFLAQNIYATEDALFDDAQVHDENSGRVFPSHAIYEKGGRKIAVIGQAFPFTPIANPPRFIPDWTFGTRFAELREEVETITRTEKPDLVVLLSHNGMGLDLHLAQEISGIDVILGGHTHDAVAHPVRVKNSGGETWVLNAGCNGKFVGCLDVKANGKKKEIRYRLLPIFSNRLPQSAQMAALVQKYRAPHENELSEVLCVTDKTLYRRGSFNGSMDQMIVDSLREHYDTQIALSPGFRWGTTVPAGRKVRMEDVLNATAMTYPETYKREMTGGDFHAILEDIADNMFHTNPLYRQGGDMVRTGGISYVLTPDAGFGKRISDLRLRGGKHLEENKTYTVSGWATAGTISPGPPIWEIAAAHLRGKDVYQGRAPELPILSGRRGDPGLGDYPANLLAK